MIIIIIITKVSRTHTHTHGNNLRQGARQWGPLGTSGPSFSKITINIKTEKRTL